MLLLLLLLLRGIGCKECGLKIGKLFLLWEEGSLSLMELLQLCGKCGGACCCSGCIGSHCNMGWWLRRGWRRDILKLLCTSLFHSPEHAIRNATH